jgi:hypothetical protein
MPLVGRLDELPWVGAVAPYRRRDDRAPNGAHAALVRLGALALDAFPATVLPNPLIHELDALATAAALDLPWVEELAADIFMGAFSAKFPAAAKIAGPGGCGTARMPTGWRRSRADSASSACAVRPPAPASPRS